MAKLTPAQIAEVKAKGFLINRGTENFSGRIVAPGTVYTADDMRAITEIAEKFGNGNLIFTTRLAIEIQGIPYEKIPEAISYADAHNLYFGGTGAQIRPIAACKGTTCIYGDYDTQALARKLYDDYFIGWKDVRLPHKFKIAIGGCPNSCMKPSLNDFGVEGHKVPAFDKETCKGCKVCQVEKNCPMKAAHVIDGKLVIDDTVCKTCGVCTGKCPFKAVAHDTATMYQIYVGGTWGKRTRMATPIPHLVSEDQIIPMLEKSLLWFRENAYKKERLGMAIDRVGVDKFLEAMESDDLLNRKDEILAAPHTREAVMKHKISYTLTALFLTAAITAGCGSTTGDTRSNTVPPLSVTDDTSAPDGSVTITDSKGNKATLCSRARVISLYASYAECYLLAGGTLTGVTRDAFTERDLGISEDTAVVGTVKEPNVENIIELNPDYVIMSADLTAHADIEDNLKSAGIQYGYYRVDTFEDYSYIMSQFCAVTGREDLFEENVTVINNQIQEIKKTAFTHENAPNVLLMRAFSTGVKAKGADNTAGIILRDLGCHNIVDNNPSLLEDLSIEKIIEEDPDYIFISTMGDEEAALTFMNDNMVNNPAWSGLKAVKNDNCYVLPKELFHYKPNNRWADSYRYIAEILFND